SRKTGMRTETGSGHRSELTEAPFTNDSQRCARDSLVSHLAPAGSSPGRRSNSRRHARSFVALTITEEEQDRDQRGDKQTTNQSFHSASSPATVILTTGRRLSPLSCAETLVI